MKYDVKSLKAEEFINDEEILDTLSEAVKRKNDKDYVMSLIERARDCKGLSHREAAVCSNVKFPSVSKL